MEELIVILYLLCFPAGNHVGNQKPGSTRAGQGYPGKTGQTGNEISHFYKQYEFIGREFDKAAEAYRKGGRHIELFKRELDDIVRIDSGEEETAGLTGKEVG